MLPADLCVLDVLWTQGRQLESTRMLTRGLWLPDLVAAVAAVGVAPRETRAAAEALHLLGLARQDLRPPVSYELRPAGELMAARRDPRFAQARALIFNRLAARDPAEPFRAEDIVESTPLDRALVKAVLQQAECEGRVVRRNPERPWLHTTGLAQRA